MEETQVLQTGIHTDALNVFITFNTTLVFNNFHFSQEGRKCWDGEDEK